jgi:glyoxylase-like metal-dependent hydrolase (beta-lactamase superfamily II)
MQLDGYEIDIVVTGFPGKSVCHGGLGWSSIVLIRARARIAFVDVGGFNIRTTLLERMKARGLKPSDVTDLLLTHSHYDHAVNWTLFKHARIVLGAQEIEWSLTVPWGETPVPELYVEKLKDWPTLKSAVDGEEVFPGITAHIAPGHTPGHLIYVLKGKEHDVVFSGDAAKNRTELVSRTTDMTYDAAVSAATIDMIWKFWKARPGNILVPGHDMPMKLVDGKPEYIGNREAAIKAWFDDTLDKTTLFELTA